ncbi:hypothetical protein VTO42DRAFT_2812 [Malbranchea cinnamomea]
MVFGIIFNPRMTREINEEAASTRLDEHKRAETNPRIVGLTSSSGSRKAWEVKSSLVAYHCGVPGPHIFLNHLARGWRIPEHIPLSFSGIRRDAGDKQATGAQRPAEGCPAVWKFSAVSRARGPSWEPSVSINQAVVAGV